MSFTLIASYDEIDTSEFIKSLKDENNYFDLSSDGCNDEEIASLLNSLEKKKDFVSSMKKFFEWFELIEEESKKDWKVFPHQKNEKKYCELKYCLSEKKNRVYDFYNVNSPHEINIGRIVSIVIKILLAKDNDNFYISVPFGNLHDKTISRLIEFLTEYCEKKNLNIIVESSNAFTELSLGVCIKEGKIKYKKVKVCLLDNIDILEVLYN